MEYLWTEDTGAGLHFWQLVNMYLFDGKFVVESKGSNQGILDAARKLEPKEDDVYYVAFDIVFDNQDIRDKYLDLKEIVKKHPKSIFILDTICFEYIILSFHKLVEWTGTGKTDKLQIREEILSVIENHRIDISRITNEKTLNYLMKFKRFSTERVLKSLVNELTENDYWAIKGALMGECWYKDCCVSGNRNKTKCKLEQMLSGEEKIRTLLMDTETQRIVQRIIYNGTSKTGG